MDDLGNPPLAPLRVREPNHPGFWALTCQVSTSLVQSETYRGPGTTLKILKMARSWPLPKVLASTSTPGIGT